jgi:hypothetical protein
MPLPRTRIWLIVAGVFLATGALALAVVGPWALRHVVQPIAKIKASQNEFEEWEKSHPFQAPATLRLDDKNCDSWRCAASAEWNRKMENVGRQMPMGRKPASARSPCDGGRRRDGCAA